ncbi:LigA [Burkholderia sp. IT-111MI5]
MERARTGPHRARGRRHAVVAHGHAERPRAPRARACGRPQAGRRARAAGRHRRGGRGGRRERARARRGQRAAPADPDLLERRQGLCAVRHARRARRHLRRPGAGAAGAAALQRADGRRRRSRGQRVCVDERHRTAPRHDRRGARRGARKLHAGRQAALAGAGAAVRRRRVARPRAAEQRVHGQQALRARPVEAAGPGLEIRRLPVEPLQVSGRSRVPHGPVAGHADRAPRRRPYVPVPDRHVRRSPEDLPLRREARRRGRDSVGPDRGPRATGRQGAEQAARRRLAVARRERQRPARRRRVRDQHDRQGEGGRLGLVGRHEGRHLAHERRARHSPVQLWRRRQGRQPDLLVRQGHDLPDAAAVHAVAPLDLRRASRHAVRDRLHGRRAAAAGHQQGSRPRAGALRQVVDRLTCRALHGRAAVAARREADPGPDRDHGRGPLHLHRGAGRQDPRVRQGHRQGSGRDEPGHRGRQGIRLGRRAVRHQCVPARERRIPRVRRGRRTRQGADVSLETVTGGAPLTTSSPSHKAQAWTKAYSRTFRSISSG